MKVATFEVRVRLDVSINDEAKAMLYARYKLMDIPGSLSVVQVGPVDDTLSQEARREVEHL